MIMNHSNNYKYIKLLPLLFALAFSSCSQMPRKPALPSADRTGNELIVERSYAKLGIPYRYGGNTLKSFDCSGLTKYVYNEAGIQIPRTAKQQQNASRTISYRKILPGDLVFYKTGRTTDHVGIYIGNNQMIHASTGSKKVKITNITQNYWRQRFVKFGRFTH